MIMTIEKGYEPLLFSVSFWERSRFFLLTFNFPKHGNFGGSVGEIAVFSCGLILQIGTLFSLQSIVSNENLFLAWPALSKERHPPFIRLFLIVSKLGRSLLILIKLSYHFVAALMLLDTHVPNGVIVNIRIYGRSGISNVFSKS